MHRWVRMFLLSFGVVYALGLCALLSTTGQAQELRPAKFPAGAA